jgi:hypothetical protein
MTKPSTAIASRGTAAGPTAISAKATSGAWGVMNSRVSVMLLGDVASAWRRGLRDIAGRGRHQKQ